MHKGNNGWWCGGRAMRGTNIKCAIFNQQCKDIVVCCCKLNKTRVCDEHLFGHVSTCTGRYQMPIFCCTNVHPQRYTCPLFRRAVFINVMSQNELTTICTN